MTGDQEMPPTEKASTSPGQCKAVMASAVKACSLFAQLLFCTSMGLCSLGSMCSFPIAEHISLFIATLKRKVLNPINVSVLKLLPLISQNLTVN